MNDIQYLTEKYCSSNWLNPSGRWVQDVYDPVCTHALYGVRSSERNSIKSWLQENKGITRIRMIYANDKAYSIICFKYSPEKDQFRNK